MQSLITNINYNLFQIFNPVLQGLYKMMQGASLVGKTYMQPVSALVELVEMRNTDGVRPICQMITQQVSILLHKYP